VNLLYLTDRLSVRGGADLHLLQVIRWAVTAGHRVMAAYGRVEPGATLPEGARGVRVRGLASTVATSARLGGLTGVLAAADLVHVQNVMNPVVLRRAVGTGRAVVTVQDHRVFCPGPGKTLPSGAACGEIMSEATCRVCLADDGYRARTVELTEARAQALVGARLVVLSDYMARELRHIGLGEARVIPPWIEASVGQPDPKHGVFMGGRLVAHKGVLDGWRAWRDSGRRIPLRVAGEGPLADRLTGARRLGWLSRPALRRELAGARCVIVPSRWQEPFGMLGAEALAEATPVVVTDTGGTREWSAAGCVRVPAGDLSEMARAIATLDGDPELAIRLGGEGRALVAERFSRSAIEGRLRQLYREVVA
jgi:glycosyltransferase involved in cell wall biosynthesis